MRRRRLIDAVRHEVRTPVTTLLGHIELLTDHERDLPRDPSQPPWALRRSGLRLRDAAASITELIDTECSARDSVTVAEPAPAASCLRAARDRIDPCERRPFGHGITWS
ncbi:MAG: histidine kinase dimerization/phospho-acceptor domain-containing protein [Nocardioidaceae bacterium]